MKNTNIVIVVGNLTGDAELKQTATGVSYIQFSIAVNKEQYNAETKAYDKKTDYLNLELKVENLEFLKFATTISDSDKKAVTEKIKVDANEPITEETLNFEIV